MLLYLRILCSITAVLLSYPSLICWGYFGLNEIDDVNPHKNPVVVMFSVGLGLLVFVLLTVKGGF